MSSPNRWGSHRRRLPASPGKERTRSLRDSIIAPWYQAIPRIEASGIFDDSQVIAGRGCPFQFLPHWDFHIQYFVLFEAEGRLDILVNNAGVTKFVPHADLDGLDDDTFDLIMRTNVRGPFACARAFQPLLAADGGGLIVNITSIAGRTAFGSNVAYCASKAALDSITMSLARALAPEIRVVSVSPGLVDTELSRTWDPAVRQHQIDATPLGRLANPDEVGRAVLAVATTLDFTNGSIITVDGGRPLGR